MRCRCPPKCSSDRIQSSKELRDAKLWMMLFRKQVFPWFSRPDLALTPDELPNRKESREARRDWRGDVMELK